MKLLIVFVIAELLFSNALQGQCLPAGISLATQADIDNFNSNYSNCTQILGGVTISGSNISNLNGLSNVTYIGGNLILLNNPLLNNISGLNNLQYVGGTFAFEQCNALSNISGINALNGIGGDFSIKNCSAITTITGLAGLQNVGGSFSIESNTALAGMNAFNNLSSVGTDIIIQANNTITLLGGFSHGLAIGHDLKIANASLINLDGFTGPISIGNDFVFGNNNNLYNVTGLNHIDSIGRDLYFVGNYHLDSSSFFSSLQKIGRDLIISNMDSLRNLNGFINIHKVRNLTLNVNYNVQSATGLSGLNTITGKLDINSFKALQNLNGFNNISNIPGGLEVKHCDMLTTLQGLENLNSVLYLSILNNTNLVHLNALGNLTTITEGGISITGNNSLTNVDSLSGITIIPGQLAIQSNPLLQNLNGFSNLTSVKSLYIAYSNFQNLNALGNLTTFTGNPSLFSDAQLTIYNNYNLNSIAGLNNLSPNSVSFLNLSNNSQLSVCNNSFVCSYLVNPNNVATIANNAMGCNTRSQVEISCPQCLQGGITFYSQNDIDNFPLQYPNCNTVNGSMTITGNNITNLSPLTQLQFIKGNLTINSCPNLTSLNGLHNLIKIDSSLDVSQNLSLQNVNYMYSLTEVGQDFALYYNTNIQNLNGFAGLQKIGRNMILDGMPMTSFSGISNLDSIKGYLQIRHLHNIQNMLGFNGLSYLNGLNIIECYGIQDLDGLQGITTLNNGFYAGYSSMINFHGLNNVTYIGGLGVDYNQGGNAQLQSMEGFNSLQTVDGHFLIGWANRLKNVNALINLTSVTGQFMLYSCDSLVNLNGLQNMNHTGGLSLLGCNLLENLTGLNGLVSMTGSLRIEYNHQLKTLSGLGNFGTIISGDLKVTLNDSLNNLTALSQVTDVTQDVIIENNTALPTLTGFNPIGINGNVSISSNNHLTALIGLQNVSFINGNLSINANPLLSNMNSLNHTVSIAGNLSIQNNLQLAVCHVKAVCDYLAGPLGTTASIFTNYSGCNSPQEVSALCTSMPLPITLEKFTATCSNPHVLLSWTTVSEINNKLFELEQSTDAKQWIKVGEVLGSINSSEAKNYTYKVSNAIHTGNYFRIKQTDLDNKSTYSDVVAQDCSNNNDVVSIYPNPSTDGFYIATNNAEILHYELYNLQGTFVEKKSLTNSNFVSLKGLVNGIYMLKIFLPNHNVQIIKVEKR